MLFLTTLGTRRTDDSGGLWMLAAGATAAGALGDYHYAIVPVVASVYAFVAYSFVRASTSVSNRKVPRQFVPLMGMFFWIALRESLASPFQVSTIARVAIGGVPFLGALVARSALPAIAPGQVATVIVRATAGSMVIGELLGTSWNTCRPEKCAPFGQLFAAAFQSENTIALWASAGAVFVLVDWESQHLRHTIQLTGLGIVVVLAGSRGSPAALAASVFISVGVALFARRRERSFYLSRRSRCLGLAIPAATSLYLINGSTLETLSFRGRRWVEIREKIGVFSPHGGGVHAWSEIRDSIGFQTFPHSQYGLLLVYGGVLAIALYLLLMNSLLKTLRASSRSALARAAMPTFFIVCLGIIETTWNPAGLDDTTWIMMALILSSTSSSHGSERHSNIDLTKRSHLANTGKRHERPTRNASY